VIRKILRAIFFLALVYLLPGLAALVLSGGGREFLLARLSQAAKVKVSAKNVAFDFPAYLRFQPALAVEEATIANPPGFRSPTALTAGKLRAQVKLFSLFGKEPHVTSIEIDHPTITVEQNAQGETNIEALLKLVSSSEPAPDGPPKTANGIEIDRIAITAGEVSLVGFPEATNGSILRQIDMTVRGIAPGKPFQLETSARLYKGDRSRFQFAGSAGPSAPAALPVDGKVTIEIAPNDIPAEVRKREIGEFLNVPGAKSMVRVESQLKGDLYGMLNGSAELTIADLFLGKDEKHKLAWSSKAPATFQVNHALGRPELTLDIRNGTAKAGSGAWAGNFRVQSAKGVLSGSSSGSIRGVDSNEFLSAFSTATDKVSGELSLPRYEFQFAGKDSVALRNSLAATGKVEVSKGRISALNILNSIENELSGKPLHGAATEFTTLKSDLHIAGQNLRLENIDVEGPELRVRGAGTVSFNHALDFKLDATITGAIAGLIPGRQASSGPAQATIPVTVTGTVEDPSVKPNVGKLAGDVAKKAIGGFLDKLLKK